MNRLRQLRRAKGLTQNELAKEVGTAQGTLSGWESGRFEIAASFIPIFCKYFGCTADYLLGTDDPVLVNNDPELTAYLEELKNRPDMRMLFSLTKTATKEDVEKVVKIVEVMLGKKDE